MFTSNQDNEDYVKDLLQGPMESMLQAFRDLPSFSVVTSLKVEFVCERKGQTRVQLEAIIYGGILRWYIEYLHILTIASVEQEVAKFRDYLVRLNTYISIPFDRLPLILPLPPETPQYQSFNNLIAHRFRLGV